MGTGNRVDPFVSFNFLVEIDGIVRGAFSEVSGLDATIDVVEFREGGRNTSPIKLPGLNKYSNITLKWGMTADDELYQWHRAAVLGDVQRRNGSIIVLDRQGSEVARWNFFNGWPTKYTAPSLSASGAEAAVETVEIVHEGLERV